MLVNQQELQLIQQSVGNTLPMTQSVRSWGGSVFPLLLKHTAMGFRGPKHLLASLLAISQCCPKSKIISEIYGRLNLSLVRSVAKAILSRRVVVG